MAIEGVEQYAEQKKKGLMAEEFHLDPNRTEDPVEKLVGNVGPTAAFDELASELPQDTDPEVIRKLKLVLSLALKQKSH